MRRLWPLALALMLLASACGQKSGVAGTAVSAGGGGGGGGVAAGEGEVVGEDGTAVGGEVTDPGATGGDPGAGGTAPGGGGGTAAGGGAGGGGGGGTAARTGGGGTAAASGGAFSPGPNDKNGVTDREIVIGIHAPVTGAAPFPQNSFNTGKDIYWQFLKETKGGVHGRNIKVVFRDDAFNPSRAVQVCREMVEQEKAFILIGGGGADQITACAKYASQVGVPYLSAGVNEEGIAGLKTYFALSQTYSQQSRTIAQLVKKKLGKTKIGIVVADTPSFADAQKSFTAAAQAEGLQVVRNSKINKNASQSEALAEAQQQQQAGAEAIYILTSPTVFIQFAQQAASQAYAPQYVGPGITSGLNIVATAGCPGIGEARFLSPFFQLDDPATNEYKAAYTKYRSDQNQQPDDIGFALWGLSQALAEMFDATGKELGRAAFMNTLVSGKEFGGQTYPKVKYAPGKPFGGSAMHLLKADCGGRRYITESKTVAGF
jgi:branched-chain amino acid transport system substrate-binding protein